MGAGMGFLMKQSFHNPWAQQRVMTEGVDPVNHVSEDRINLTNKDALIMR